MERLRQVAIAKLEAGDSNFWKLLPDRVWPAKTEVEVGAGSAMAFAWLPAEREASVIEAEPEVRGAEQRTPEGLR